jgi:hypothetical protein
VRLERRCHGRSRRSFAASARRLCRPATPDRLAPPLSSSSSSSFF